MIVGALGGISAHRRVSGAEGWWSELAGPGKTLDPEQVRLVGIDWLEGGVSAAATGSVAAIGRDSARSRSDRIPACPPSVRLLWRP